MSGNASNGVGTSPLTGVVLALQQLIQASYLTQQTLAGVLKVNANTTATGYTVGGLPSTAPVGAVAYASNGRNTGQGVGAGTGCLVVGNGTVWTAVWSGVQVTA